MIDAEERRDLARKVLGAAPLRVGSLLVVRGLAAVRVVVFARLFLPSEIGTAALALTCVGALGVLANFGFLPSVIRRRQGSPEFDDTAFTLSLIAAVLVFAAALAGAPLISRIMSADLDAYIRFAAFLVFAVPLSFPRVFWEKQLDFNHPSVARAIPELASFAGAVALELLFHLGVWSLVLAQAGGALLAALYVWWLAPRRPRLALERRDARELLGFGTPLMLQSANGWVMARGDNLLVAFFAGATQLAYYNFAWQLPMTISALAASVDSMLFPVFARLNESRTDVSRLFNLASKMWAICGSFFGFAMIVFADAIVLVLYGPSWAPAVPILRLMSVSFVIRFCSGYAYDNLVLVRGRTRYMMKWGFANTLLVMTLGLYMIREGGAIGGAWFWILQASLFTPLLRLPLIHQELGSFEFVGHVWPALVAGGLAALCAHEVRLALPADAAALATSALVYATAYAGVLLLLDRRFVADTRRLIAGARS